MRILITGGCGFLGSNLASEALHRNARLTIFDNMSRPGSALNRKWLRRQGAPAFRKGDIADTRQVKEVIRKMKPDAVFHVAGQVAMTSSVENPRRDFEVNALGTLNVLEAVRQFAPEAHLIYSSTNKVYGDLAQYRYIEEATRWRCADFPEGFDESVPLDFRSPYGCSKGCADQYMLDYGRTFGLRTTVFRHSSMYGSRQFATYDQGWIGWFCRQALQQAAGRKAGKEIMPFTISGDGKQVRDLLHADDMAALYFAALEAGDGATGEAFNIGGSMANSLSLIELFSQLESLLSVRLEYKRLPPRLGDQRVFVANTGKALKLLNWRPTVSAAEGLQRMLSWAQDVLEQ